MFGRRRGEAGEPRLRPDDSGWLAELRKARDEPDLVEAMDDEASITGEPTAPPPRQARPPRPPRPPSSAPPPQQPSQSPPPAAVFSEAGPIRRPVDAVWLRAVVGSVALVLGVTVGLATHARWIATAAPGDPAALGPPHATIAAAPAARVSASASAAAVLEITELIQRPGSVTIRWSDPSGGQAVFVVTEIVGSDARPVLQVPAGQTIAVVTVTGPQPARYCFRILAITSTGQAISPPRCTDAG